MLRQLVRAFSTDNSANRIARSKEAPRVRFRKHSMRSPGLKGKPVSCKKRLSPVSHLAKPKGRSGKEDVLASTGRSALQIGNQRLHGIPTDIDHSSLFAFWTARVWEGSSGSLPGGLPFRQGGCKASDRLGYGGALRDLGQNLSLVHRGHRGIAIVGNGPEDRCPMLSSAFLREM